MKAPSRMLERLAVEPVAWQRVDVFQIDERVAPEGHADRNAIRQNLERIMRPSDAPLDAATAREVALRMGLKAVIEGEVGRAGTGPPTST